MAEDHVNRLAKQCLPEEDAEIHRGGIQSSPCYEDTPDEAQTVVEQKSVRLFMRTVGQISAEISVDSRSIVKHGTLRTFRLTTASQFAGSEDGDGFGRTDTMIGTELIDAPATKDVQAVLTIAEDLTHQFDRTLSGRTTPHKDRKEFGFGERSTAEGSKFLPRTVGFIPRADGHTARFVHRDY